ncbi:kelch repeat-containing protein [Babesia caballi]|uniref:tRNA(Phe) 7-[(3-amino-3-carboxypropyl)-4-demethylwyosine(37)-N(4)]-methyltransferase n=1 Tax=Babesia caballi TaxID=5871 RepID=A0AAV4LV79_BABCB|nr:kelch repeat-containing protein [Babesia caballi]
MRTAALSVAELLGAELLESIYLGTEYTLTDTSAALRKDARVEDNGLEVRDVTAARLYRNVDLVFRNLRFRSPEPVECISEQLRSPATKCATLDCETRNYINGRDTEHSENGLAVGTDGSKADRSLKGSVDVLLIPFLRLLLRTGRFVSTSCCSGRVVLFESNVDHVTGATKRANDFGRAGRFLYSSHCHLGPEDAAEAAEAVDGSVRSKRDCYHKSASSSSNTVENDVSQDKVASLGASDNQCEVLLKVESFIVHVECASLGDAAALLQVARSCGLKQSGIISCSKRIILSIRGSNQLESPVAIRQYAVERKGVDDVSTTPEEGVTGPRGLEASYKREEASDASVTTKWLVSQEQFAYLLATCNKKLTGSIRQMLRLYWTCVKRFGIDPLEPFAIRSYTPLSLDGAAPELSHLCQPVEAVCHRCKADGKQQKGLCGDASGEPNRENVSRSLPRTNQAQLWGKGGTGGAVVDGMPTSHRRPHVKGNAASAMGMFVAVKSMSSIKMIKTWLESHGLYDKSRKIIAVPSCGVTNDSGDVDAATDGCETRCTPDAHVRILTADMLHKHQIAALIPVLEVKEATLEDALELTPELTEHLVVISGRVRHLLNDKLLQLSEEGV